MTTTILRPNATVDAAATLTGGASTHACTSDDSDASYASENGAGEQIVVGLGTVALPAGAVMKHYQMRARLKAASNPYTWTVYAELDGNLQPGPLTAPAGVPTTFTNYAVTNAAVWTQAQIDAVLLKFTNLGGSSQPIDVAELYLDVTYALIPVANITSPTGTPAITGTNRPIYTWTHTPGSDGGSQTFYEVKVYTAAQYGAGGFSPDTSATFWTSGVVVGAATSQLSGVLTNTTTYRVYVRTAQTVNGVAHWSAWDFEGFSIAVTTSDVSAITATPTGDGRIAVAVDRAGGSSAWDLIEVQRSIDAGVTWEYLRGGQYVNPTTATAFSTGDASNFDIADYEVPNGVMVLYRARATRIVSGLPISGAWVQTAAAVAWTSSAIWLKAPDEPALNRTVEFRTVPEPSFEKPHGVHRVLGRPNPVVISDELSGGAGTLTFQTENDAEMNGLFALLRKPVLLLHPTPGWAIGPQYIATNKVRQIPLSTRVVLPMRRFEVGYHQVDPPSDPLANNGA